MPQKSMSEAKPVRQNETSRQKPTPKDTRSATSTWRSAVATIGDITTASTPWKAMARPAQVAV